MLCNSGYINEGFLISNVCHVTENKVSYFFNYKVLIFYAALSYHPMLAYIQLNLM